MLGEFFIIKNRILDLLKPIFRSSDLVLDAGCGEKPYYHSSIKSKIVCVDLKHTKKSHLIGNITAIPLKKSKFDGIISVNSLYYSDPNKSINEFSHILKKNGKLVIIVPFIYPIHDAPYDKYRLTEYVLKDMLQHNFNIRYIKTVGGIFNLPAVLLHSLMKGIPLLAPKTLRSLTRFLSMMIFYPFYIIAQLFSILDILDKSRRWPTYYFVLATKK